MATSKTTKATTAKLAPIKKATVAKTTNLSSKQISAWKKSVDTAITTHLVTSLKKAYEDSAKLSEVTKTAGDSSQLSYRFNDLAKLTNQAATQLTKFMASFNTSIDTYIKETTKAEENAAEKARKAIDQFAEAATKISKLSMQ